MDHIARVLEELDVAPSRYFGSLAAELSRAEHGGGDEVREPRPPYDLDYMEDRLRRMAAQDREALERERRENLDSLVRRIVRDELGRKGDD